MLYEVKYNYGESNQVCHSDDNFDPKTEVIVKAAKGVHLAQIIRRVDDDLVAEGEIQYIAERQDFDRQHDLQDEAIDVKLDIKQIVRDLGLPMKIVEVYYSLDKGQLFVSFVAENRVDFRELLKILAGKYRTRIELRQIGAKDAAQRLGGIGPCGRPLCCSEFLVEFPPVSIKFAKNQSLSLNQSKLSGLCGKLMCCLSYENDFYTEAQKAFPDYGKRVRTEQGEGKVIGLNVLMGKVKVRFADSVQDIDVKEVEVI
jgi:cell fate regulator YaaT (PSP1 superfamily)